MNTTPDVKFLRNIMPQAVITVNIEDDGSINYVCDLRHAKITDNEHDKLFQPIKEYFGDRLSERFSICTGYFTVYINKEINDRLN